MRKKYDTLMTLALAGAVALTGTGVLSQKISSAKAGTISVKENQSAAFDIQADDSREPAEKTDGQKASPNQSTDGQKASSNQNTLGLELPADAEIKEENEDSLKFQWDGREITYYASDSGKKIEPDMLNIEEAVRTAVRSVWEYTKENNIGNHIQMALKKNIPETEEYDSLEENNFSDSSDIIPAASKKNEGIWYYAVDADGINGHSYTLLINSISGQVFGYADYYDKNAAADEHSKEELERLKPEYCEAAGKFIKENLHFEEGVSEYYAFTTGLMVTENGTRDTFDIFCRTESGDIVMITMDQLEKRVAAFEINPL